MDESGKIVVSYEYDAWGRPEKELKWVYDEQGTLISKEEQAIGEFGNYYLYKGYYYDVETGLYYLNARYYDPTIGRFLSRDPAPGNQKDRLDLNSYLYCKNNPVIHSDPSGLKKKTPYWYYRHYRYLWKKTGSRKYYNLFMGIWTSRAVYGKTWYYWRRGYWRGAAKTARRKYGRNSAKARRIARIARKTARVNKQWNKVKKIRTKQFLANYAIKHQKHIAAYIKTKVFRENISSLKPSVVYKVAYEFARQLNPDNPDSHPAEFTRTKWKSIKYLEEAYGIIHPGHVSRNKYAWGEGIHDFGYPGGSTREWAENVGFSESEAKIISKANMGVDAWYTVGGPQHFNWLWPFADSRERIARQKLAEARRYIAQGKKNQALEAVGQGLHPIQDQDPHGYLPGNFPLPWLGLAQIQHLVLSAPEHVF